MITETLTWFEVTERLPDNTRTKLIEAPELDMTPDTDVRVWPGWYEDGHWYEASGLEIEGVVRWAEMPRGGLA